MRVLTVTCDRCKQEITNLDQAWPVEVRFGTPGYQALKAEWCRSCTIEMGLLKGQGEQTAAPRVDPPPTIEDFIREIVREEIQENRS